MRRIEQLIPYSKEHHHALLLVWKIRQGMSKQIPMERIAGYVSFFYQTNLLQHFMEEERFIFPLVADDHPLKIKALKDHLSLRMLAALIEHNFELEINLDAFATLLNDHIRFEERELFAYMQSNFSEDQIQKITKLSANEKTDFDSKWGDHFWKKEITA